MAGSPPASRAARRCATFSSRSTANRSTPIRITGPASCRPATTRRSDGSEARGFSMKSRTSVRAAATAALAIAAALAVGLAVPAGTAAAAPKPSPGKLDRKRLEIERHVWTAQFYLRKAGDVAGAAREYKAVLALDPQNVDASLALASLYARDGKPRLAVDVLTRLTKKSPKNDQAWLLLARLHAEQHDDRAMKAAIDKALAIDPDSAGAYALLFERAQARLDAGDASAKADALDAARRILA